MGLNPTFDRWLALGVVSATVLTLGACGGSGKPSPTLSVDPAMAQDVRAEAAARSAQTAMETYAVDHDGSYAGTDVEALVRIEPALKDAALKVSSMRSTYGVAARSESGTFFAVARMANGDLQFKCNAPGTGNCPNGGHWKR
jgi:hypothetical protein